jgi:hypothetical protein
MTKHSCVGLAMDLIYIGAIVGFLLSACALAVAFDKLGEAQ